MLTSASFSGNGQRIVTAGYDHAPRVWDAVTGKQIAKLEGHSDWVTSASFSGDGRRIVTASEDRTARVWDADTGKQIAKLEGHTGAVASASFSGDGRRIVTASEDGTARVWDSSLEHGSPAEIAEYVRRYVPFKIENGQVVFVGDK